jgi:hypothetical protein
MTTIHIQSDPGVIAGKPVLEAEVIRIREENETELKAREIWLTQGFTTVQIPIEDWKRIVADVEKQLAEFPLYGQNFRDP